MDILAIVAIEIPLAYSGLVDQELAQELQKVWVRLDEKARGASGELKLRCG
jgi:hypothetical protein